MHGPRPATESPYGKARSGRDSLGTVRGYDGAIRSVTTEKRAPNSPVVVGEWQELEVRAEGDRLTVTLNGVVINVVEGTEPLAGYIGLERSRGTVVPGPAMTLSPVVLGRRRTRQGCTSQARE